MADEPGALPALVAALIAGSDAAASGIPASVAADSAIVLGWVSLAGPDIAARLAELPGALPGLVVAGAAADNATTPDCITALAQIASASPELACRVAQVPRALLVLVAAAAGGVAAAEPCPLRVRAAFALAALFHITKADPALADRVSRAPGALPALVAAVTAGGGGTKQLITALPALAAAEAAGAAGTTPRTRLAAVKSASVLSVVADAGPGLAQRLAAVPGALSALDCGMAAGGELAGLSVATLMACVRLGAATEEAGLAQRVAEVPGILPALCAVVAAGGFSAVSAVCGVMWLKEWAETAVAAAGTECAHCGGREDKATGKRMSVCTCCDTARYCNAECQRLAWSSHKAACRAVAATRGIYNDFVRSRDS